nr:MAG TPA: Endonuclease [Caudoviricetes sp.]
MVKRTKFNVSKNPAGRTFEGIVFDSAMEMQYYRDFVLPRMTRGEIVSCDRQVKFPLQEKFKRKNSNGKLENVRAIDYVADFVLKWSNGRIQVIDTKGMADATALLKRKLFWYKYPDVEYLWITRNLKYGADNDGWIEFDALAKIRRKNKKQRENKNEIS